MRQYRFALLAGIALFALILAGCGGSGGGGGAITGTTGIATTIGATTDVATNRSGGRSSDISAPLDRGALIEAFDFTTRTKLATGSVGADGKGVINLPAGKTVLVTVTGTRNKKRYRLSLIIATTTAAQTSYVAGPASTLTAEALGKYYGKGIELDTDSIQKVKDAADAYFDAHPSADVCLGGALMREGKAYGASDGINATELASVVQSVPSENELGDLPMAKNAVQQLRDATIPLEAIVSDEIPDIETVAEQTANALSQVDVAELSDSYRILTDRLGDYILPLATGSLSYNAKVYTDVMDLPVGKAYKITSALNAMETVLVDYPSANTPNVIKILRFQPDGVYTTTFQRLTQVTMKATVTCTGDSSLLYTSTFNTAIPSGADPAVSVSASFKDKYISTPLAFQGTFNVTGPRQGPYSSASLSGQLSSAEANCKGGVSVFFPSALPSGAPKGASVYKYPTRVTFSNLSASLKSGTTSGSVSGGMDIKLTPEEIDGQLRPIPTDVTLTNGAIAATTGGKTSRVSGSGAFKMSTAPGGEGMPNFIPTIFSITGFSASLNNGQITASGSISFKGRATKMGDTYTDFPTDASLTGKYANTKSGLSFDGSLDGKWTNPGDNKKYSQLQYAINAKGTLSRTNYRDIVVDLAFSTNGAGGATLNVNKLAWATQSLQGSGNGRVDDNGNVEITRLTLVYRNGVKLTLDQNMSGLVSVNDEQMGTIGKDEYGVKVSFKDKTFRYLVGGAP